jgi:hypothetical protein
LQSENCLEVAVSRNRQASASEKGEAAKVGFKGLVDAFDPGVGLSGWCARLNQDGAEVELELVLKDQVVARTRANIDRPDVCEALKREGQFGFCFEAAVFDRFLPMSKALGEKALAVRVAGEALVLPMVEDVEDLSRLLDARDALLNCEQGERMLERLRALNSAAASLMTVPFRGAAAPANGFIEAIAPGANDVIWFLGWMERECAGEFSASVLDRRKFRAGAALVSFERDDLPPDAVGVAGAIMSDWSPSSSSEAIVIFGADGRRHLRTTRALRHIRIDEVLDHIEDADIPESRRVARELRELAEANDCWDVEAKASGQVKLAVDAASALQGFGIFVRGWIVSPSRSVKSLALKIGDRLYQCDQRTLSFVSRPDLLSAFPASPEAVRRAGFSCIFRCDAAALAYGEAGMKILYEDGPASHHRLDELVIDRLMPSEEGDRFRDYYPNMEKEAFFGGYATAYYEMCARHYGEAIIDRIEEAESALIMTAPSDRHSLYLFFEELRHNLSACAISGMGLVVIAGQELQHGEIHELFGQLADNFSGPASLVFAPDGRHALWTLDSVLLMAGIRSFVFTGQNSLLGPNGWRSLGDLLAGSGTQTVLEMGHPCEPWREPERSMCAFAWTTESYLAWRRDNRLPMGAPPAVDALAGAERVVDCGSMFSKCATPPTLRRINRQLGLGV